MWILAFFTEEGVPATGLTPLVKVLDVETGYSIVYNELMMETGDGFYRYEFGAYEPLRDYAIICDSVTLSGSERYTYASSGEYHDVLDSIESTVGMVDIRTTLLRKIQTNRLELNDGNIDNWTLYDDDGDTPLLTFSVSDKLGQLVVQQPHMPSRRSMADGDVYGLDGNSSVDIYMRKSVYDPNNSGIVQIASFVSDGVNISNAVDIKYAVDYVYNVGSYLSTIVEDESPELGGDLILLDNSIVINTTPSGEVINGNVVGYSGDISYMDIGENEYGFGTPLYMSPNGDLGMCSAVSGTIQMPCLVLALEAGIGSKKILWKGIIRNGAWNWVPNDIIYISDTEGDLTNIRPTGNSWKQIVGLAISTDIIKFEPVLSDGY